MQGYAPAAQVSTAGYEFNDFENTTIRSTARYARIWGIISLVSGVLLALTGVLFLTVLAEAKFNGGASLGSVVALSTLPSGVVNVICGVFYLGAAGRLAAVVDTQGNDIALLMVALQKLKLAFMLEAIVSIIGFAVGFVAGFVMRSGS